MINVVRRSQVVGLTSMDGSTATQYDRVEEVWLDESGQVVYLAGSEGYTPLEQISVVGDDAVLTYSNELVEAPSNIRRIDRLEVSTPTSAPLGWVEDFLFDWSTGDIAAYILGGTIAEPFGGTAVLFPDDVKVIDADVIILEEGAKDRLKSEKEGLKGFLSEKSQQVKYLVQKMSHRLRDSIKDKDEAETVRVTTRAYMRRTKRLCLAPDGERRITAHSCHRLPKGDWDASRPSSVAKQL